MALFANHTAVVNGKHILDLLIENKVNVVGVFGPEHGFRGRADAGEHVQNDVDKKTGVRIFSLYNGKDGKPNTDVLKKTDVLVVDIQDVGLRFYTYYISMLQLMNACVKTKTRMLILDRPNPNGSYVDGPLLDMKHKSGVGALPIPVVHGLTLGEMAGMINGEGWLDGAAKCRLSVVTCNNYTHSTFGNYPLLRLLTCLTCSRYISIRCLPVRRHRCKPRSWHRFALSAIRTPEDGGLCAQFHTAKC